MWYRRQLTLTNLLRSQKVSWQELEERTWTSREFQFPCPARKAQVPVRLKALNRLRRFSVFVPDSSNRLESGQLSDEILTAARAHPAASLSLSPSTTLVYNASMGTCACNSCLRTKHGGAFQYALQPTEAALPAWAGLLNYIPGFRLFFDFSDMPCVPFDIGNGIAAKTGFTKFHYRPGYDVALAPLAQTEYSAVQRHVPPSGRIYLLTLQGTRSEHFDATRKELYRIHNGKDIVLAVKCVSRMGGNNEYDAQCMSDETRFDQFSTQDLMAGTTFALVTEGYGLNELKLIDAMSAGCIPVIVYDHYVLPFEDILDWESFSIRVPEYKLEQARCVWWRVLLDNRAAAGAAAGDPCRQACRHAWAGRVCVRDVPAVDWDAGADWFVLA